jgi:hypothetical protein
MEASMNRYTRTLGLAFAAVLCAAAADTIREPETGKSFDAEIKGVTPGVTLTCTGVGCRKKTVFAAKVYAIALWVDAQGARTALSEWRAKSGEDLAADQRFYDALSSADIEKRLALVFVRDLKAGKIQEGFKESLNIAYSRKLSPAAEQFLALFTTDVQKGQSIELRSLPGGVIEVVQNSATLARLPADRELATAVWAIYFHEKLADDYLEALKPKLVARIDAVW